MALNAAGGTSMTGNPNVAACRWISRTWTCHARSLAAAGATAVVQPGGSVRDADVIAAADRLGVAMVVTGVRHFRH